MSLSIRRNAPLHLLITPRRARPRYEVCGVPVRPSSQEITAVQHGCRRATCGPVWVRSLSQQKVVLAGSWFVVNIHETFLCVSSREVGVKMRMTQMKGTTIPWVRAVRRSSRTSYKKSQKCQKRSRALPRPPRVRSLRHCLPTDNAEKESFALFHFLMMRINLLHQRYPFIKYSAFYSSL